MLIVVISLYTCASSASADSLWERRDPYFSSMMWDTKARRVGDVLTILLTETTTFDGREERDLKKETSNNFATKMAGLFTAGSNLKRSFSGNLSTDFTSNRELNGRSDYRSERTLNDRMAVRVVGVEPNGNLMIEGFRTRVVANEERTMRISGVVRPTDIGANNTVLSQYIANFTVEYLGRGPESSYTNNGWLGRIVNRVWPF
jgi:flagellar L-ring protein precursor FlgH